MSSAEEPPAMLHRAECSCGWTSYWTEDAWTAADDGEDHVRDCGGEFEIDVEFPILFVDKTLQRREELHGV